MAASPKGRNVIGFVVLFGFFALAIWVLNTVGGEIEVPTVGTELIKNPAIENTRASGSKGFYDWLGKLGYKPKEWSDGYSNLPSNASVMVTIAPNFNPLSSLDAELPSGDSPSDLTIDHRQLTAADGIAIKRWVSAGHTLLLFASSLPSSTASAFHASGAPGSSPKFESFASELGVYPESAEDDSDGRHTDFTPLQPSVWTLGVDSIEMNPGYRLYDPDHKGLVLFSDVVQSRLRAAGSKVLISSAHSYPVAEVFTMGKGRVVAVSDDFFVSNKNILKAQNATFLYRILSQSAKQGDTVLFDEYYRIVGIESPSLWVALGKPTQYAFLQLCGALLIAILILAPRLGRPVPASANSGRSSAEYVTSLAGLYQSAGVTTTALETVYRQFLREVCQKFGLPIDTTLDKLADVASRRGGVQIDSLKRLLVSCERSLTSTQAVNSRDLIVLVRSIERFRKELGIG